MRLNFNLINKGIRDLKEIKINRIINLVDFLSDESYRLKSKILPNVGAVYIFWWTGSKDFLTNKSVNRIIKFKGPGGRTVNVEFTDEWIDKIQIEGKIPLYIGKTDNLSKRISQHLQLKTKRGLALGEASFGEDRKTTSNQVRDRIERMFFDEDDVRKIILNNIGLSYVILDGDIESVNRFYLEDKAIGEFYPLFNIDIER